MTEDTIQPTQVMPAGAQPEDRTMVAGVAPTSAAATQMGGTLACPVCQTTNSALETYCSECGFLLTSVPGSAEPEPEEESGLPELVETKSGRRLRLRPGVNTIGRENADIMLMDSTVSRRHAQIALEDGAATLTDLGSTNGTQVDGTRLPANEPTPVEPGAVLRFGSASLALVAAGAEAPAEPTAAVVPAGGAEQTMVGVPAAPLAEEAAAPAVTAPEDLAAQGVAARLVPTGGPAQEILLRPGTLTIGRRAGNDLVIATDPFISGRHAELTCVDGAVTLTDVGSTNGTLVNGQRLEAESPQPLEPGDEVQMGQGTWRFERVEVPPVDETGDAPAERPATGTPAPTEPEAGVTDTATEESTAP